jgi:hypothetical protein
MRDHRLKQLDFTPHHMPPEGPEVSGGEVLLVLLVGLILAWLIYSC